MSVAEAQLCPSSLGEGWREAEGRGHAKRTLEMSEYFLFAGEKAEMEVSLDVKELPSEYCVPKLHR